MKDIVLFESTAGRDRREKRRQKLVAMHKSDQPPSELLAAPPRKLRWKRALRFLMAWNVTLLLIALCASIYFCVLVGRIFHELRSDLPQSEWRARQRAAHAADPEQRQQAEQTLQRYDILNRQLRRLQILVLVTMVVGLIGVPVMHVMVSWFVHIRPELELLRHGTAVRAMVTGHSRWLGFAPRIEFGFTTERGQNTRARQLVGAAESSAFNVGDPVWVLYHPRRPRRAMVYGLRHQFAELTMDD